MHDSAEDTASHRFELSRDFDFDDACYALDDLNEPVSTLHLSQIFDASDPRNIDANLGGKKGFDQLMKLVSLRKPPLKVVFDVAPGFMRASLENPFFAELLRVGPTYEYLSLFEIEPPSRKQAPLLTLPFLRSKHGLALSAGEFQLNFDAKNGFLVRYYDHRLPLAYACTAKIIYKFIDGVVRGPYFAKNELDEIFGLTQDFEREQLRKNPQSAKQIGHIIKWFTKSRLRLSQLREFLKSAPLLFVSDLLKHQHFVLDCAATSKANYRHLPGKSQIFAVNMSHPLADELFLRPAQIILEKYEVIHSTRVITPDAASKTGGL